MALFGKLFEKKICSICGNEIKFLGNRKLEDGNMCKDCAEKLSPWFSDRRSSTVEEIKQQLAYREENKEAVREFNVTRSLGDSPRLLLDEDARKFTVTSARNLVEANPDILDFSQVTGCDMDVSESRSEAHFRDREGKSVSYTPPRYTYSYNFEVTIRVNHPYFDTMKLKLNPSRVEINPDEPVPATRKPNERLNRDYREYEAMGNEIKKILTEVRQQIRNEVREAAAPKAAVVCPYCGATTTPDAAGNCEYCGAFISANK